MYFVDMNLMWTISKDLGEKIVRILEKNSKDFGGKICELKTSGSGWGE